MSVSKPYPHLREFVSDAASMDAMVSDATDTVEAEIDKQKGLVGVTLRASFRLGRKIAPEYVDQMMRAFFEPSLEAMTPFFHQALDQGRRLPDHFEAHAQTLTEALLCVTDAYAAADEDGAMKNTYQRIRGRLGERMPPSMRPLGALVERHLPADWRPGLAQDAAASQPEA